MLKKIYLEYYHSKSCHKLVALLHSSMKMSRNRRTSMICRPRRGGRLQLRMVVSCSFSNLKCFGTAWTGEHAWLYSRINSCVHVCVCECACMPTVWVWTNAARGVLVWCCAPWHFDSLLFSTFLTLWICLSSTQDWFSFGEHLVYLASIHQTCLYSHKLNLCDM